MTEDKKYIDPDEIRNLMHINAENDYSHTTYRIELERFFLLAQGDDRAVDLSVQIMRSDLQGKLSNDPLRNIRYLFIVNTGLATRFAIEAGAPQELVYSTSDVFIQNADVATTEEEIVELNREFWKMLVKIVRDSKKGKTFSRAVMMCIDHITSNFNRKMTLEEFAELTKLTPCYLSSLFKKETGMTLGDYITKFRTDSARALLTRTDYSYLKIALSLGFCSQSYFTKVFKERVGMTPKDYRRNYSDKAFYV